MHQVRLRLLDAIARAAEANREAMELALQLLAGGDEVESSPAPKNVERPLEKTSPRLPFKTEVPPPLAGASAARKQSSISRRPTAYQHLAWTKERALAHVRKAYEESISADERIAVVERMKRLAEVGLFSEADIADYVAPKGQAK